MKRYYNSKSLSSAETTSALLDTAKPYIKKALAIIIPKAIDGARKMFGDNPDNDIQNLNHGIAVLLRMEKDGKSQKIHPANKALGGRLYGRYGTVLGETLSMAPEEFRQAFGKDILEVRQKTFPPILSLQEENPKPFLITEIYAEVQEATAKANFQQQVNHELAIKNALNQSSGAVMANIGGPAGIVIALLVLGGIVYKFKKDKQTPLAGIEVSEE